MQIIHEELACVQNRCGCTMVHVLAVTKVCLSTQVHAHIESVVSAVKLSLSTVNLEDQDRVLVLWTGRWCSCMARYLETVGESNASGRRGQMINVPFIKSLVNWDCSWRGPLRVDSRTRQFRRLEDWSLTPRVGGVWLACALSSRCTCKDPTKDRRWEARLYPWKSLVIKFRS